MRKKLAFIGITSIAITAVCLLSFSKSNNNNLPEKKQTAMTDHYWQKTPCPAGFVGYICSWTNLSYPTCNDHGHWNCVER